MVEQQWIKSMGKLPDGYVSPLKQKRYTNATEAPIVGRCDPVRGNEMF
jgi:hypothetical protein